MKEVQVQGGLGNQLFCAAFAVKLARLTGQRVCLDASRFGDDRYGRVFELEKLLANVDELTVRRRAPPWRSQLLRVATKLHARWIVTDDDVRGTDQRLATVAKRGLYYSGYWQHPNLANDEIFREIAATHFGRHTQPQPHIALHFRSYKEEIIAGRRSAPTIDYFSRSLALLRDRLGTSLPAVAVTDSIADAEKLLGKLDSNLRFVQSVDAIDDFRTILNATASILTNSSFSWWAGYLSRSDVCVYPAPASYFHYPEPAPEFVCL